ncbi:MAG: hypothetical protein ACOX41_10850 [Anaerovoracaceae bacterium]|jgi:hypothetical protein
MADKKEKTSKKKNINNDQEENRLKKLKRGELLEIMLAQSREIDSLREEIKDLKAQLADREIKVREAGSLAEASLQLTKVFEEAQKAADLYLDNLRQRAGADDGKAES